MSRSNWAVLMLLVISIFINYIDRANLSVAAPLIQKQLTLSPTQVGSLLSAFFWTYALLQLSGVAGWIADRFPVGIVFACGFFVWSAATIATGFLSGFATLYVARLFVGAGESLAYPGYSRIFATDIPQDYRGRANALLDAGSKLGPALGIMLGGLLLARIGWQAFFFALGAGSMLWLIPWLRYMPRSGALAEQKTGQGRVLQMLRLRSAWGTFIGHFCGNYFWFFLLTWLPSYLMRERGFSIERMATIASIAYLLIATATIIAGWISDGYITRGSSPTVVRKTVVTAGLLFSSIILPAAFAKSAAGSIIFLLLACVGFGTYTSNHWAITQTLAGPSMAGRWTSIQNGIGNLSGVMAAWLTGFVVDRTGSFRSAFVISSAVVLVAALMWSTVVGPVKQVNWEQAHG